MKNRNPFRKKANAPQMRDVYISGLTFYETVAL
jgi:hypothetical protein